MWFMIYDILYDKTIKTSDYESIFAGIMKMTALLNDQLSVVCQGGSRLVSARGYPGPDTREYVGR